MVELSFGLAVSAFVAGLLMFLAPCTLPLVPAFLAFISGVKPGEISDKQTHTQAIRDIRLSALGFVLGFSLIFISFGLMAGFFSAFFGQFKSILSQVGGVFVILFALLMLNVFKFAPLSKEYKIEMPKSIKPGNPISATLIGMAFALGWTPCVGPVLASVLLLASTSGTILSGGILLAIFSLGLAVPFLTVAILYGQSQTLISKYSYLSKGINIVGGVFLLFLGLLLFTDNFGLMVEYGYRFFNLFGFEGFFDLL